MAANPTLPTRVRQAALDPRFLAIVLGLAAVGCAFYAFAATAGAVVALAGFLVAGAAAGYANSGST